MACPGSVAWLDTQLGVAGHGGSAVGTPAWVAVFMNPIINANRSVRPVIFGMRAYLAAGGDEPEDTGFTPVRELRGTGRAREALLREEQQASEFGIALFGEFAPAAPGTGVTHADIEAEEGDAGVGMLQVTAVEGGGRTQAVRGPMPSMASQRREDGIDPLAPGERTDSRNSRMIALDERSCRSSVERIQPA